MTTDRIDAPESRDEASPAPFPLARGRVKGYEPRAVDAFLAQARAAFEDQGSRVLGPEEPRFTAATVRDASFPLVRRGYVIGAVDAAMGRIEDAFAAREREEGIQSAGATAWVEGARTLAQELLERLSRPPRRKFRRTGMLRFGYRIDEVDLVAGKLAGYFQQGDPVSVEQVRQIAFRMQRRGYDETQVDAVLDGVVEVMLAVR